MMIRVAHKRPPVTTPDAVYGPRGDGAAEAGAEGGTNQIFRIQFVSLCGESTAGDAPHAKPGCRCPERSSPSRNDRVAVLELEASPARENRRSWP